MNNRPFIAAVSVAAVLMLVACQPSQDSQAPAQPSGRSMPAPRARAAAATSIEAIGGHAEDLYDHGKLLDWRTSAIDADGLREAVASLGAGGGKRLLQKQIMSIDSAISRRDRRAVMHIANDLTRQAAEMMRPYSPRVPVEVTLLDFYGRELEMAAAEEDLTRLQSSRGSIASIWSSLRSTIAARGGETTAVRFDSVIEKLTRAGTAEEFGATATPILDEVDALENVFAR